MQPSRRTTNLIWGRSGSRCYVDRTEELSRTPSGDLPIGEIAHIVAEEQTGARGSVDLADQQRSEPDNLLLLCPNHHREVDNHPEVWTVGRLRKLKVGHEQWVRNSLDKHGPSKRRRRNEELGFVARTDHDKPLPGGEPRRGSSEGIEAAEYSESIGDVWRAAKIYEVLASDLKGDNADVAKEMNRRAKKCRSAAAE